MWLRGTSQDFSIQHARNCISLQIKYCSLPTFSLYQKVRWLSIVCQPPLIMWIVTYSLNYNYSSSYPSKSCISLINEQSGVLSLFCVVMRCCDLICYLSHCYTIAWDRLSNQFFCLCMCVCMHVCMYVSVGTLTVAFFNRSSRNLVRTFGVWIGRTD